MADKDLHYYEPVNGHGLKHDPFNAIIAPRPIGWISSRDAKGNVNLAPYSFFNGFCYHPPIIGFSSTSWKDSVANIQESGEFVWNLATMDLAQQMNATAAHVAHDVSEFKIAGLTAAPSRIVDVPRVAESPVSFECERLVIVEVGVDRAVVLGKVVAIHVADEFVLDAAKCYIDTPKLDLIGRMHGRGWYARTTDRFDMPRIDVADWPVRAKAAE